MIRARINATGEVVEVRPYQTELYDFMVSRNEGMMGELYTRDELTIIGDNELEYPGDNTFNYWTRLEHQYAGMAMQGLMSYVGQITPKKGCSFCDEIVGISFKVAHALVEKYKKEE